jgi:hypothetical protein
VDSIRTKSGTGELGSGPEARDSGGEETEQDGPEADRDALVGTVSDERLIQLFSRPRSPKRFLAGLRVLGFSADSVQFMTGAKSRDVVYSWAAGRAKPGLEQARRLDEIRRILYFVCSHRDLGPDTAWMLFNARFGQMTQDGPTAMELIAQGEAATVMGHLEGLVDEQPPS